MLNVVSGRARGNGRRASFRGLVLLGTALGCSLAMPAHAEKVVFNGTGDFTLDRADTLSDGPRVVDIQTATGNLNLKVGGVNVTNNQGDNSALPPAVGIAGSVTGNGNIVIRLGTGTASGNQTNYQVSNPTNVIDAKTTTGTIEINSGTISATNIYSTGINAISTSGSQSITAANTSAFQRGINSNAGTGTTVINSGVVSALGVQFNGTAIEARGGRVDITSGTATSGGGLGSNGIVAFAGTGGATVRSTTVNANSQQGSGIFVNSAGAASITSDTINANVGTFPPASMDGGAIYVSAPGALTIASKTINLGTRALYGIRADATGAGATSIDSDMIKQAASPTVTANGIQIAAATGSVTVKSNDIAVNGKGIVLTSTSGPLVVSSTKIVTGGNGIDIRSTSGAVTVNATTTTATGTGQSALLAATGGDISVTADTTAGTLYGINAQQTGYSAANASGKTSIKSTNASAAQSGGIGLLAQGAALTVDSATSSGSGGAIVANAGVGGLTLASTSATANGTSFAAAIQATSLGVVNIDSKTIAATTSGLTATANGAATIKSDTISLSNSAGGVALSVAQSGAAATTVDSKTITTAGSNGRGISVTTGGGTATVTSDTIAATGQAINVANSNFSSTVPASGAITVTSKTINATGTSGSGIFVTTANGPATVTSDTINSTGQAITVNNGSAATAGGAAIAINSKTIVSTGTNGGGISASSRSGTITVVTDSIASVGSAVSLSSFSSGALSVTSNSAIASGNSASGLSLSSTSGTQTVTSTTASGGLRGIFTGATSGITTINSVTASGTGTNSPNAIVGQGATVNINSSTASLTNTNGSAGAAIFVNSSVATVKSTTVSLAGDSQAGIQVFSNLGATSVESGTITAAKSATGIKAIVTAFSSTSNTGSIAIKSDTITLNGAGSLGIDVSSSSDGATSIDSGTITGGGITVNAGPGTTTIKSDTINAAANGDGIDVFGGGTNGTANTGAVTINSNKINLVGGGSAIQTAGGSGTNGTQTITSTAITSSGTPATSFFGISASGGSAAVNVDSGSIAITTAQRTTTSTNPATIAQTAGSLSGTGISVTSQSASSSSIKSGSVVFTGAGNTAGIALQALGAGSGTITSGSVSVIGNGGYGVLGSTQTSALSITSGDVTTTGTTRFTTGVVNAANARFADGIDALSDTGAITVVSTGTVSTAGTDATGINVEAGRARTTFGTASGAISTAAISVTNSGTVKTTGAGAGGISIAADNNAVTLTSANVTTSGANANGIDVSGGAGAINVTTGNVATTGATSDAVHIVSASGPITATVNGALSAASGTGLFIDPPSAVTVTVAAGASARGSVNGLSVVGTANSITNLGTIANMAAGAAIASTGATSLDNSGTITAGTGGIAVQLGATNDTVTLRTGSSVSGSIAGGGGTDAAVLAGTVTAPTATQTLARFTGFSTLNVASGYWTAAPATPSTFATSATIASGASFEVGNAGAGLGISTPSIVDNGTLVVRSTAAGTGSTFGTTVVSGTGVVALTGAGTVTLDGVNSVQTTGGLRVDGGSTLLLTGSEAVPVATTATGTFQLGNGGTTGAFTGALANEGNFVFNRSDSYSLTGAVTGAGTITKMGAGTLTFGTNFAFTGTTNLVAGSIKLSTPVAANTELDVRGTGTLDLSGTTQVVAELAGTAGATVNIAGGSLTDNQATSSVFAANLAGAGSFTKAGTGRLNFTGTNTYTGATAINGGTLAVNGSIVSPVTVNTGGTLGGTGTVAAVTIGAGGTFAPGNSVGTINVAGPVTFAAGSTFQVEANMTAADRVVATGAATISGGTVAVLPDTSLGAFGKTTTYNILTASAVTGTFTTATSTNASLIPILSYTGTAVNLTLGNAALSFGGIAIGANQLATANAVQARGVGNAVFSAVLLQPTSAAGQAAFDNLSGEIFASVPTVLVDEGRRVREAVLDRALAGGDGPGVWAQGLYNRAEASQNFGVASVDAERRGVVSGIDFGRGGWRIGAAAGYINSDIDSGARASHADVDSKLVGGYGGWTSGRFAVQAGGSYTWHDLDTRRAVAVGALAGSEAGSFKAHTSQGFGELSYNAVAGPFTMAPFAGYAHVRTHTDGVTEVGNAAALVVAGETRSTDFVSAGVRIGGEQAISATTTFLPHIRAAYVHGSGDLGGTTSSTFGGAGTAFGITGAALGRNTYSFDGGFDLAFGGRFQIGAGAYGSEGGDWSDYGARLTAGFKF